MHYNFNTYRGRKMFNLNFSARNDKQAIADATDLVSNFAKLRWIPVVLSTERSQVANQIVSRSARLGRRAINWLH